MRIRAVGKAGGDQEALALLVPIADYLPRWVAKNANAMDLMTNAPSPVDLAQLAELHIAVIPEQQVEPGEEGET